MRSPAAISHLIWRESMLEVTDDILQKLAFQLGVLTLLKEKDPSAPMIDKALEELDGLISRVF